MSNGCFLGVMCNKPIRVSSSIPFKSQLRSCHDGFAIYTAEFGKRKDRTRLRDEMELLVCEQIDSLILIHAMTIHYDM